MGFSRDFNFISGKLILFTLNSLSKTGTIWGDACNSPYDFLTVAHDIL
jgi:hypothetical protein